MVARTAPLPNIKKLFVPDPGYVIIDADLDRADVQVVIWEADDDDLKAKIREGVDLHIENAKDIFGLRSIHDVTKLQRQQTKGFVHGTNYAGKPPTMAKTVGLTTHEADQAQKRWFSAHPGILEWHRRTEMQLQTTRTVYNMFGYRRFYFERIEGLLPQALAWNPQSTVGIVTNRGLMNIYQDLPQVQLLLQVHDSLVFQIPHNAVGTLLPKIKTALEIVIPYDDPLIIGVGCEASSRSWGDCKKIDWSAQAIN